MLNSQIIEAIATFSDNKTKIRKKDVLKIQSIRDNPITELVLNKFTINKKFEFNMMLEELKKLSLKSEIEPKLNFLFNIYDVDNDGYISRIDLFNIIKLFTDDSLSEKNIQNIVDRCFLEINQELIDFPTFKSFIQKTNPNLKVFMRCKR
ncbi:Ca2+/calmodulin-dependent protein phosphatase (calcineurin subunit B), EF-Hand superfamily protein [Pseudoloma neurophilia]|uniref:Calcineurin subunit B n=1 Tax=Pseudoloma neurophilia TaxID=146866 RepID=A0A0R0LW99_9MICR|nr:Ca2+/calmodulin-dependent protein phosphatase (calcineurin subunit B), EF-Hand superfamily protein [Pseudoloma neurophilia]